MIYEGDTESSLTTEYISVTKPLDCDIQLINLRTSTDYGSSR